MIQMPLRQMPQKSPKSKTEQPELGELDFDTDFDDDDDFTLEEEL